MSSAYGGLSPLLILCLGLFFFSFPVISYQEISDETLKSLPRPKTDFDIHTGALLSPILRTRVPGTEGSRAVLNHFVDFFQSSLPDWKIELQNSTSKTPVHGNKDVPFVNFIASRDPPWAQAGDVGRLTLVAHYDSKYEPEGFIGAIDSAAPCAMIMHAMRSIDAGLTKKWEKMRKSGRKHQSLEGQKGIQVLFLDGEEAFKSWSAEDSLYGARSLAEQWDDEVNAAMSVYKTPLSSISLFVLLDLLGSKDPTIQSYFETTHWAYKKLAALEKRLRGLNQFKSTGNAPKPQWFIDGSKGEHELSGFGSIQDDHIPFLDRGVEILHVIDASPFGFPKVWHTLDDNAENLDIDTVEDWSVLITAFAAEWMELEGFMQMSKKASREENVNGKASGQWNKKTEL
ncbi:Glutaminyl cyclase [Aspergillus sclerotialis]|uniref:Peptide hydrolase n=1 Tax=Aspergillus sclerotialis TaxID=2070753 RepID=A0A3A2ZVN1_9EURO|nr:Glutaminyl cyclase [Aspergillus sclerotialis]